MSLIHQTLPHYHINEIHSIEIRATPERVYEALKQYRMGSSPLFRFLFSLRRLGGLPTLLLRRQPLTRNWNFEEPSILNLKPFVVVAEAPDEEVVLGLIGKFWQPAPPQVNLKDGEEFLRFDDPQYAKAAMNFLLESRDSITILTTETRVHIPDPTARLLFRFYWTLIGFFSGWIRVDMLKRIKRVAESENQRLLARMWGGGYD
jgi:hypothetical protein